MGGVGEEEGVCRLGEGPRGRGNRPMMVWVCSALRCGPVFRYRVGCDGHELERSGGYATFAVSPIV